MRASKARSFLVRRLLQRMERGEIDESEAAAWLSFEPESSRLIQRRRDKKIRLI